MRYTNVHSTLLTYLLKEERAKLHDEAAPGISLAVELTSHYVFKQLPAGHTTNTPTFTEHNNLSHDRQYITHKQIVKEFWQKAASHGRMFHGRLCNVKPAAAEPLSCRYWRLNDPFCCVHLSRDSQCFTVSRTTPKIAPSVGDFDLHLMHGPLGPQVIPQTASRWVQPFLHSISMWPAHTQTDRPHYVRHMLLQQAASMRCVQAMRPKNTNWTKTTITTF